MFEYNEKFWDNIEPGYYDKNFKSKKVDNSIQQLWHFLTFKKQEKYLLESMVHLDYACGPGTQIGLFSDSKSLGYDASEEQIKSFILLIFFGKDSVLLNCSSRVGVYRGSSKSSKAITSVSNSSLSIK